MSISKCMICQKNRRPTRNCRNLFPADCIGCGTPDWQPQVNTTEKWQEICLTPHKFARRDSNSPSSKQTGSPLKEEQTQYLQIGYRHTKQEQHWTTKAFHLFGNIIRRGNSAAPSTCNQSPELSEPPSSCGVETTENRSQLEWPTQSDAQLSEEDHTTAPSPSIIPDKNGLNNCDQESKVGIIGRVNEGFVEATESAVDVPVLTLMQYSENCARAVSVPENEHTLSLKCCCSDADLTKPSMCGDRACVSCTEHDHRLIARQVSMAAEAAAHAAASFLAVPLVSVDPRDAQQLSYTSVATTPAIATTTDVHDVLHSVRSALEHRQRRYRPEPIAHTSVPSQTTCVQHSEVATCTTPPTQDAAAKPILLTLGKMYQKHLYISALLHNLTSFDVKKLGFRVNECRTKIEALEDVCKQQKTAPVTADMAVGNEERPTMVDVGVGEVCEEKTGPVTVDTAVGEGEIEIFDKETQSFVEMTNGYTEPTNFGVETGVQVAGCEGLGATEVAEMGVQVAGFEKMGVTEFVEMGVQVAGCEGLGVTEVVEMGVQTGEGGVGLSGVAVGPVESVVSEDPWRRISQISDMSSADIHSLNYCNPLLLEAYMLQLENATKTENDLLDIKLGSSSECLHQNTAASVSKAVSTQKYRLSKPVKVPARTVIRRSPNVNQSSGRFRATGDQRSHHSPPRQRVVPSVAIQTHPVANSRHSIAASARFAGGRSGMNNIPLRRGLSGSKPTSLKFVSTVRK